MGQARSGLSLSRPPNLFVCLLFWVSILSYLIKKNGSRELDNVKESLKREMAISRGLRGTIGKLQEENRRLGENAQQGKVDGIEIKDKTRAGKEEMKILRRDIRELREKVHELEKENEMLQQKLKKKDRELERFQALETGEKSNNIIPELFVFIFHISWSKTKITGREF